MNTRVNRGLAPRQPCTPHPKNRNMSFFPHVFPVNKKKSQFKIRDFWRSSVLSCSAVGPHVHDFHSSADGFIKFVLLRHGRGRKNDGQSERAKISSGDSEIRKLISLCALPTQLLPNGSSQTIEFTNFKNAGRFRRKLEIKKANLCNTESSCISYHFSLNVNGLSNCFLSTAASSLGFMSLIRLWANTTRDIENILTRFH